MRKYNKDNPNSHAWIRAQLLHMYGYFDLLTGEEIPDFHSASYHHIIKDAYNGEYNIENGAMLLHPTHDFIHNVIETNDPELFDLLTECLLLYKYCLDSNQTELIKQFQEEVQPEIKTRVLKYKSESKRKKYY